MLLLLPIAAARSLIILTSNVGSSVIAKGGATVGFQLPTQADPEADKYARVRGLVLEELKVGARRRQRGSEVQGAHDAAHAMRSCWPPTRPLTPAGLLPPRAAQPHG
jgi:hypothetical protein